MPMMIWLKKDLTRYLDSHGLTGLYNNLLNLVEETFDFKPTEIEIWKKSTSKYLGGEMIKRQRWEEIGKETTMVDTVEEAMSTDGILRINGGCNDMDQGSALEIYGDSRQRLVYSDVFFEMGNGLYDELQKMDNLSEVLHTLKEGMESIELELHGVIMGKKTTSKRRVVERAFISDNIPNEEKDVSGSSYLFFYLPRGKQWSFLKFILRNVALDMQKEKKKADPFRILDFDRMARAISEYSQTKGYVLDKYAVVSHGSIAYMARPHSNLDRMFGDYRDKIAKPVMLKMQEKFRIDQIMQDSITEVGPGSFSDFERKTE